MRVLIVGGSEEYVGAVYLAALAAFRAGAESVIVMTPEKVAWALNALSPDLVTRKLPGKRLGLKHREAIMHQLKTADVLLIGNGTGTAHGTQTLMRALMRWQGLKVVDADALKALKGNAVSHAILTPNAGEWKLLTEKNDVETLVKKDIVILKKGARPALITSLGTKHIPRPDPGLTKAGTGDVLAGLCAGYLARGLDLAAATERAAATSSHAARLLAQKRSHGFHYLASDLLGKIKRPRTTRKRG